MEIVPAFFKEHYELGMLIVESLDDRHISLFSLTNKACKEIAQKVRNTFFQSHRLKFAGCLEEINDLTILRTHPLSGEDSGAIVGRNFVFLYTQEEKCFRDIRSSTGFLSLHTCKFVLSETNGMMCTSARTIFSDDDKTLIYWSCSDCNGGKDSPWGPGQLCKDSGKACCPLLLPGLALFLIKDYFCKIQPGGNKFCLFWDGVDLKEITTLPSLENLPPRYQD
jgi:hypothetical protein